MNKPKPKREITITHVFDELRFIYVRPASEDARQWLLDECGVFGVWEDSTAGRICLIVYAEFDVGEVVKCIQSYEAAT